MDPIETQCGRKDIPDEPGYQVGVDGSVWSCIAKGAKPRIIGATWHRLRGWLGSNGYLKINIGGKTHYVHRLVLEVFVGPCPAGMEACHNDGDERNCHLENLRWDTSKANKADTLRHGNRPEGGGAAILIAQDVREIRRLRQQGMIMPEIAQRFGVGTSTINAILKGRSWSWLDGESKENTEHLDRRIAELISGWEPPL